MGSAGRQQGEREHPTARATEGSAHVSRTSNIPQGVRARLPPTPLYPCSLPPLPSSRHCPESHKKRGGSQGEEGRGPQQARELGERRPRPTPGAGWREAGHAHAVAGRRARGGGGTRVQFSAGAGGRCGSRAAVGGEPDAGAGSAPPAGECGCARPRWHTREPGAPSLGDASRAEPPRCCAG